jgi:mono/diheme cytochrome c family protein
MSAMMPDRRRLGRLAATLGILLPLLAGCQPGGSAGERLYRRHCDTCHGVDGGGGILYLADEGANLLDDAWRYGGDRTSIEFTLLEERVPKHPTWDLTNQEIQQLVDHILVDIRGERR